MDGSKQLVYRGQGEAPRVDNATVTATHPSTPPSAAAPLLAPTSNVAHPSVPRLDAYYIHRLLPPLKEHDIRLVRVHPREQGLLCTIEHASIQDQPVYTAVSYTWGSDVRDHYVYWEY